MNDMTAVIVPKSDQINADDLLSGPITITITGVKIAAGQEQPVSISFAGSDKAYRPCKSMARVLVAAWGPDASQYTGRSLTLYCDPKVKWGGMEVGGIRISHMSHIDAVKTMALTQTRGNKKPYTVKPLVQSKPKAAAFDDDDPTLTDEQAIELHALCTEGGADLTEKLKSFATIDRLADLPARHFERAKRVIGQWRVEEKAAADAA